MMQKNKVVLTFLFLLFTFNNALAASEVFLYDSKNRRDPFLPLVSPDGRILVRESEGAKTINDVSLQGILWDPQGISYAILNGNPVKEGEEFEGLEVIKISKEWVAVRFGGEEYTLKITEEGGE